MDDMNLGGVATVIASVTSLIALFTALWGKKLEVGAAERRTAGEQTTTSIEAAAEILERHAQRLEENYERERKRRIDAEAREVERDAKIETLTVEVRRLQRTLDRVVEIVAAMPRTLRARCPQQDPDCPGLVIADQLSEIVAGLDPAGEHHRGEHRLSAERPSREPA